MQGMVGVLDAVFEDADDAQPRLVLPQLAPHRRRHHHLPQHPLPHLPSPVPSPNLQLIVHATRVPVVVAAEERPHAAALEAIQERSPLLLVPAGGS